jgi:hypothetical protein
VVCLTQEETFLLLLILFRIALGLIRATTYDFLRTKRIKLSVVITINLIESQ